MAGSPAPETVLFHRSWYSECPLAFFVVVIFAIAFWATFTVPDSIQIISVQAGTLGRWGIPLPLFGIFPVVTMGFLMHRLYDERYEIALDHVRVISGLLSLRKHEVRLEYRDLRGVEVERGVLGRILNYGDLKVGSSMHNGIELVMTGVKDPSHYRDLILTRRRFDEGRTYQKV